MAYKIEVTADTLSELAGKVLALAAQFQTTVLPPAALAEPDAPKPRKAKAKGPEPVRENADPAEVGNEQSSEGSAVQKSSGETPTETSSSHSEPLDFEKDVAPLVLETVAAKGRAAVSEVLDRFGVERASQIDEHLWPELVTALKDIA